MSLPFVPRNVKTKSKVKKPPVIAHNAEPGPSRLPPPKPDEKPALDEKPRLSEEDYTTLVTLALSDYALFSDPDLRRKIDQSVEKFISLPRLLKSHDLPETPVAKALRAHASDTLEVRMVLSAPVWSSWNAHGTSKDSHMFDVRRKIPPSSSFSREGWKQRTIYIENIPVQYISIHGIFHLIHTLIAGCSTPNPTSDRVQGISFLSHHLDKPGDAPKPKSFALVTLLNLEDVRLLLNDWPWERTDTSRTSPTPEHEAAVKFGLRALQKERWDQLKEEYLAYRGELVEQMAAHQNNAPRPASIPKRGRSRSPPPQDNALSHDSPFPPDCLIFVKHVHSQTNKTTLRSLFSQAGSEIDYVDFNKGMDTCHLRLATPLDARKLNTWFSERRLTQDAGLDGTGVEGGKTPIEMELVQGRQEELYWEKVPAKVRFQAVEKALGSGGAEQKQKKRQRTR
ncbi:hypothetical protein BDZ89DRAFT_1130404 [Hymenopellis radicata]|nr:hypothetical protein BDZ89DRAFT_1130404 [Hymenopellis radicata]